MWALAGFKGHFGGINGPKRGQISLKLHLKGENSGKGVEFWATVMEILTTYSQFRALQEKMFLRGRNFRNYSENGSPGWKPFPARRTTRTQSGRSIALPDCLHCVIRITRCPLKVVRRSLPLVQRPGSYVMNLRFRLRGDRRTCRFLNELAGTNCITTGHFHLPFVPYLLEVVPGGV